MSLLRNKSDLFPTSVIVGLFACDLLLYLNVNSLWLLLAWTLSMALPKACICSWNHHHQHLPTFKSSILNRGLELIYALHTGITTNAWVLHHVLGHHLNYTDQTKDESAWKTVDGRKMGAIEYTFTIALTGYYRAYQVGKRHPKYQRGFLTGTTIAFLALVLLLWNNWLNALLVFIIPMSWGYLCTCWHTYYHHAGLDSSNEYEASFNILNKWYNICTGNLGYHTAHHIKPGLHWSKLPEFHASIANRIPLSLYRQACLPFRWIPESSSKAETAQTNAC